MKIKLTTPQLKTLTLILQESIENIPFQTGVEKSFYQSISEELEASFLGKIIKKKEQYKIELKPYQVLVIQMAAMWDSSTDGFRLSLAKLIINQTDQELVNLKMK